MKILVRHAMGTGGWFVCGLVYSMLKGNTVELTNNGSGHNLDFMYDTHTLDQLVQGPLCDTFWYYCEEEYNSNTDISEGINWFTENLKFNETGVVSNHHIMRTHARNLNPMIYSIGIDDVKVINIHYDPNELDQIIYNFVYKTVFPDDNWLDKHSDELMLCLNYHYPNEYLDITPDAIRIAIENRDAQYLTRLLKLAWKQYWERYPLYTPPVEFNTFNVSWKEIVNGQLISRLDELARFLGVNLLPLQSAQLMGFILNYQSLQKTIPFSL